MSHTSRNSILLLAVVLGLGSQAFASSTATISVGGAETAGDTNTITVSFNSFSETVAYGQFSTQASIASAFAAMFSRDYLQAGLCASATGSVINFKLKGAGTFGPLSVTGSSASFQLSSSGFLAPGASVADTGTVILWVAIPTSQVVPAATASYGYGATPAIVAESLAGGVAANSPVNVTAVNDAVYIESKTAGAGTDYPYFIQITDTAGFSPPSFSASQPSGSLDGGADAGSPAQSTLVYHFAGSYDGVGNLTGYTDSVMGQWSFSYDSLNRLTAAAAAANAPAPYANNYGCWSYDAFGNRLSQSISTTACANSPPRTSWANYDANNRFTNTSQAPGGVAYDAAGNVTYDGANSYLYDGEGRVCAVKSEPVPGTYTMTGYIYDADGARVAKGTITSMSCDPAANGFQTTSDYVLGLSGEQGTEMGMDANNSMAWQHTNVWAAGRLLATYDPNGLHFYLNDPLGTRRAQTDYAGVLEQSCQSLPFGDALNCTGSTTAPTEHHFTGKERDAESGNDYFGARYYASSMGRFMSPDMSDDDDPDPVPFADKQNPQSLNLYAYVRGNPLTNTDPNGNDCVTQTRNSSTTETVTVTSGTCSGKVQDGQSQTYVDGTVTGVKAGADGHSIDIGYNSHDGQSSGVQNAGGAPMPDRPGLAPGWGNNAQGYATLAAADKLVTRATVVAGVAYGSVGAAIVATDLIAGGALHSLGNVATDLTEHAAERMAERGIDPNAARAAIETAKQTGNVVQTMGRYGPQVRYVANGLKVVVATSGANAGKIITVMWDTAGRWMQK